MAAFTPANKFVGLTAPCSPAMSPRKFKEEPAQKPPLKIKIKRSGSSYRRRLSPIKATEVDDSKIKSDEVSKMNQTFDNFRSVGGKILPSKVKNARRVTIDEENI